MPGDAPPCGLCWRLTAQPPQHLKCSLFSCHSVCLPHKFCPRCSGACVRARACGHLPSGKMSSILFLVVPCATRAEAKHFKAAHGDMIIILIRDACSDVTGLTVGLTTLSGKGQTWPLLRQSLLWQLATGVKLGVNKV